ncbi:MAG: TonB-dependent receptor [Pseudomonadota bacterium]
MKSPFKLSLIALAILAPAAQAATEEIPLYRGEEIVVTATRTPQPVSALLGDISVITAEEIARAGQSSLVELLQYQPGVEVTTSGGLGSASNVHLRGANSGHTLVLIDGVRVNSATLGSAALEAIPLAQIDRVEILRGPVSALYGADAIGGVIQIFTKEGSGKPRPNLSAGAGSYATRMVSGGIGGESGASRFSLQGGQIESDGFSATTNPANPAYNPDKDGYRNTNFSGTLSHLVATGQEIGLTAFYSRGKTGIDRTTGGVFRDDYVEQRLSTLSVYSRNRLGSNWESQLRFGSAADDSHTVTSSPSLFRTDQTQLSWQHDVTLRNGLVTAGLERLEQKVTSSAVFTQTRRAINSLFLGYQNRFGDHQLQANARHDDNSQFGSRNTGLLAYGYRFAPQWRASASAGTAFKAPTFNDLYYPLDAWGNRGNPSLQPERAINREIALHYESARQRGSLIYFNNRVADLIAWVENPPGSWTYVPFNVSQADLRGIELSWRGEIGGYELGANLTAQRPEDAATGKLLVNRATRHGSIKLNHASDSWSWGGELLFSGERYNDTGNTQKMGGYGIVNLTAGYALTKELTLRGRINNIFDKHYELVRDFNTPGANLFVSLHYQPR